MLSSDWNMKYACLLFALTAPAFFIDGAHVIKPFGFPPRNRRLQENRSNWWEFGLPDPILNEVALYYLGQTWYQNADVADVLETIYRTNSSDPWSWTNEMRKTAARMESLAGESEEGGHKLSAGQAYLRAATYLRASLHRHPDPFHEEVPIIAQRAVDAFETFLTLTDYPCEPVRIPYENNVTLPGYLCLNPATDAPAPIIIFNEGKDGWAEDGKYVVDEAMKRGYHVLLWDGPGMGQTIRIQGLPFRHDWEAVLTPLLDYVVQLEEVDPDRIALISVSLGGFLGPRAAIFDHRLKALVVNPGVLNWYKIYEVVIDSIDPNLLDLLETDSEAFDDAIDQAMSVSDFLHWGLVDSMWHHGVNKPSELMFEIQRYNIEGMVQNITSATLVIDAELEERGQAWEFYLALTGAETKEYILFTAEEGAQLHVQPGATAILSMRTFNWLDDVLVESKKENVDDNSSGASTFSVSLISLCVSLCSILLM